MRQRAKVHLPGMMMTLLSIIQALSLELLWSRLEESDFLWGGGFASLIGWLQVGSIFLGIMLVWFFYVSIVMRFTWLPSTRDSINPFLIGILEFSTIELLGPGHVAAWLFCMALLFAFSTFTSNEIFRRARRDSDNTEWFVRYKPSNSFDILVSYSFAAIVAALGLSIALAGEVPWLTVLALLSTTAVVGGQLLVSRYFWEASMHAGAPEIDQETVDTASE